MTQSDVARSHSLRNLIAYNEIDKCLACKVVIA